MAYKKSNPNGQATMANSEPVVIASDQSVIPVSDNSGSLTVDNPQLSVVGTGTEAAALRVTIASDSTGVLSVDDNGGSLTVDGTVTANLAAGTNNIGDVDVLSVVPGTNATNLGKSEDAAHTSGDVGTMSLGVRNSAMATLTSDDGDYSPIAVDSAGRTNISGQIGHDAGVNGNPIVIGAVASAAAPSDVSADQDAVRLWALRNGSQVVNLASAGALIPGNATDGLLVNLGANNDISGTVTANLSATDNAVLDAIEADTTTIAGAVSGTEMQVDVVAALPAGTNAIGKLVPADKDITGHTNYAKKYYTNAGAVTDGIIWSPAAGTRWHITSIYIQTSAAATITLEDDKAGGDEAIWKSEFTANQGVYMTFDPLYPWASGEDAADLIITTTAGNVYVTVVGYEI